METSTPTGRHEDGTSSGAVQRDALPPAGEPRGGRRGAGAAGRLRAVRTAQAAFDGETRMRRLLTAVLLAELVLVIVLAAAQVWIGLVTAVVVALVVVVAISVFGPHDDDPAVVGGSDLDHVVAGQREELAELRQRAAEAEESTSLLAELARRHRSLLFRQLSKIDEMESREADPAALGELFALDHLATRMRRCTEGVLVLAGSDEPTQADAPVPASEVLRGAVAEIEDFSRVEVSLDRDVLVAGPAVVDVVHLLAELVENATVFSSPTTPVRVRGHATSDAFAVVVSDQGVGMTAEHLEEVNRAFAAHDMPAVPGKIGFPVVARLAARHGVYVALAPSETGGVEVTVALPPALVLGPVTDFAARPVHAPVPGPAVAPQPVPAAPEPDLPAAYAVPEPEPAATYEPDLPAAYAAPEPDLPAAYDEPVSFAPEPVDGPIPFAPEPVDAPIPFAPEPVDAPIPFAPEPVDAPIPFAPYGAEEPIPFAPYPDEPPAFAPAAEPEPYAPAAAAVTPPPATAPEPPRTSTGLQRRIPLSHMAPQIAPPEPTLADDVASEPAPDRSRHLFSAYRDGLTLGRTGLAVDERTRQDARQGDGPDDGGHR